MNRMLPALCALALSFPAFAQGDFSLSGHIQGLPDSVKLVLVDIEDPNNESSEIATVSPKDGKFELKGKVVSPRMCKLLFKSYSPSYEDFRTVLSVRAMVDASPLILNASCEYDSLLKTRNALMEKALRVSGSQVADEFAQFRAAVQDAEYDMNEASYLSAHKFFETNNNPDTVKRYEALKKIEEKKYEAVRKQFIEDHPSYNISAYEVQRDFEKIFKHNSTEIDALADMVKVCPDTARTNMVEKRRKFAHRYALGMKCPQIEVTTPDDKIVDFNSRIEPGKFTFIDFWASWCGPCRQAIPHVKDLYAKYGDRMNIYSVSVDENEAGWRKAMEKEAMPWPQYILKGKDQMAKGSQAFFLTTIPRLILLDAEGKVICSTNSPDEVTSLIEANLGK